MSNNELSQPVAESRIDWTYHCQSCKRGFNADMAHQIVVRGPHIANIMCPWCKDINAYHPPEEIERPPAVVGTSVSNTDGYTTARMFFEGGAWLQYRETETGRICLEVFNEEGEIVNSLNAEIESQDCDLTELYDAPDTYLHRTANQYAKFTVRGLKVNKPHVATALVNLP